MDEDARDRAEVLLLKATRAYGIQSRRDDVRKALSDGEHGVPFAKWVNTHLAYDNLLSADELALYTSLDESGEVDKLAALHDLAEVQAFSEDEMRAAIGELQRSTDVISKQTETLRQQQDGLVRLLKKQSDASARRQELSHSRQRRVDVDRKRIAAEVEDITQILSLRVSEIEQQTKDAGSALNNTLDSIFGSDDKLLTSLQKLGWELDQPDPEDTQNVEKLREICMRLIKIAVETVRTKLDAIYLESLVTAERSGRASPATRDEVQDLQGELDSLYSEILPVAQMSVEQQHLEPALKSMHARGGQSLHRTAVALTYVDQCLEYLLDRSGRLRVRIEAHKSHQAAADAIVSAAKAEMSAAVQEKKLPVAVPVSPVRIRGNTTTSHSRRRSSGVMEEIPLEALLQSLGISSSSFEEGSDREKLIALSRILAERREKCDDVARNAQETFESTSMAHLEDMHKAVQLLYDSIMAETSFGTVQLADPELGSHISVLAVDVENAKHRLEAVEGAKNSVKSATRDNFVQRWA